MVETSVKPWNPDLIGWAAVRAGVAEHRARARDRISQPNAELRGRG